MSTPVISKLTETIPWIEKAQHNVVVFLDWDDTIVKTSTSDPLNPQDSKKFFQYLQTYNIPWRIVTGRYSTYICTTDIESLNWGLSLMRGSTETYMYPAMDKIGAVRDFNQDPNSYFTIDYNGECVALSYMGIIYSIQKGKAILGYITMFNNDDRIKDRIPVLIDDNNNFIQEAERAGVTSFRKI